MPGAARFPIVAIGASAGGISAMEAFFRGLPARPGMAFLIATHLRADRKSLLHEVIARYTALPVAVAEEGAAIEPDRVYVLPEDSILTVANGKLSVRRPNPAGRERRPIDILFTSLALDQGEYAVGIVLSGGDSDGTLGVRAIKEHGGLTLAQVADGSAPHNPDMPNSAIATGLIDIAAPAERMAEHLVSYAGGFGALAGLGDHDEAAEALPALERARREICDILRSHSGHDFSGYKARTFLRRVRRRMQLAQLTSVTAYIERLRQDPAEVMSLFRDLLINVTSFFRDPEAFAALKRDIVPRLFEGKTATDIVRVWVPGCATGEEVYSIAILMREHMATLSLVPRVQIYATDIDDPTLAVARAARYPEAMLEGVSADRRARYFTREDGSFVIAREVRELCIFSVHNLVRDTPFSRMDLVSCRNLLIYFGPELQKRAIPLFHYSLKPGGFLFLGLSESVGLHDDLFSVIDKKHRLYQAREHAGPKHLKSLLGGPRLGAPALEAPSLTSGTTARSLRQAVNSHVLERFMPAHVVVNGEGDVVYYSARTGEVLEAPPGAPNRQLVQMARRGLRLDLRAGLREVAATRRTIVRPHIAVEESGQEPRHFTITIEPLDYRPSNEPLYLVMFERSAPAQPPQVSATGAEDARVADLEREIRDMRERMQSTIEEYETAIEELKSSNEELVSVNEEAQSSNEELEASKEEMQALNEELNTVNAELSGKIQDLDRANSDLRNLFESTQIATVFLGSDLVVRSFTPAASSYFNLRASDVGRPLTDLAGELDYSDLKSDIAAVFETGASHTEHLARDRAGKHHLVRLTSYRDKSGNIDGVVVTLVDVTTLTEYEARQRVLIDELNHRIKNMLAVVCSLVIKTGKGTAGKAEFIDRLIERLHAMARAYALVLDNKWTAMPIATVVGQALTAFKERCVLAGPEIALKPECGLSISMVVHELATNAAKYGALSKVKGRVEVTWSIENECLVLAWRESGGPKVAKPASRGFGLTMIEGEIAHTLAGTSEVHFEPDGLVVRLSLPLEGATAKG